MWAWPAALGPLGGMVFALTAPDPGWGGVFWVAYLVSLLPCALDVKGVERDLLERHRVVTSFALLLGAPSYLLVRALLLRGSWLPFGLWTAAALATYAVATGQVS